MDKNDIIEYVMNTPHNTNKAVLSSMLNQLTEGGGGGSSDFTEAKITINANLPEGRTLTSIEAITGFYYKDSEIPFSGGCLADENNIAPILMYNGSGYIEKISVDSSSGYFSFNPEYTTASGSIVWDANVGYYGAWLVTGDGSLTTTFPYPDDDDDEG